MKYYLLLLLAIVTLKLRGAWICGRRTNPFPIRCPECGHVHRICDCIHTYDDDGAGDVDPVDLCPECGM